MQQSIMEKYPEQTSTNFNWGYCTNESNIYYLFIRHHVLHHSQMHSEQPLNYLLLSNKTQNPHASTFPFLRARSKFEATLASVRCAINVSIHSVISAFLFSIYSKSSLSYGVINIGLYLLCPYALPVFTFFFIFRIIHRWGSRRVLFRA